MMSDRVILEQRLHRRRGRHTRRARRDGRTPDADIGFAATVRRSFARVFEQDSVVEARIHKDRHGLFVKTRDADAFYLLLNRVVLDDGLNIESVSPVDDNLDAVYQYLIGSSGEAA